MNMRVDVGQWNRGLRVLFLTGRDVRRQVGCSLSRECNVLTRGVGGSISYGAPLRVNMIALEQIANHSARNDIYMTRFVGSHCGSGMD